MEPQENLQADLIMEKHRLGQLVATYRGEWRPTVKLSFGCGLIVALLIAAVLSWDMILGVSQTPGEVATLVTSITGLFFLALFVLLVRIWFQTISLWHVFFCIEGFVDVGRHKARVVHWDEVETFYKGTGRVNFIESIWYVLRHEVLPIPPASFSLRTKQGAIFHFNRTFLNLAQTGPFTDIGERFHSETQLANRMEKEVSNRLWEKAVAAYQEGLPVTFDRVQVSQQGVSIKRTMRSWNEIDGLTLYDDEGMIREFKPLDAHEKATLSLPSADFNAYVAYWQEEVAPSAWIVLQMKGPHTQDWEWYVSEMPNALVFVALIAYALHQH